jgi:transcriptional regulator with XRE-family HTH domain
VILFTAEELRAARERAGDTEEQWAERLGVEARTVRRWERGATTPKLKAHVDALAVMLGEPDAPANDVPLAAPAAATIPSKADLRSAFLAGVSLGRIADGQGKDLFDVWWKNRHPEAR